MFNKKIHNLFNNWGRNKAEVPANNELLKNTILEKIPNTFEVSLPSPVQYRRPWLAYAFTAMAMVAFVLDTQNISLNKLPVDDIVVYSTSYENNEDTVVPTVPMTQTRDYDSAAGVSVTSNSVSMPEKSSVMYDPYPYYYPNPDITDTREFSKIYYNPILETRNIDKVKNRVETTIRGFKGRVDSANSGDKYGYISFVIPRSELESFRSEMESIVGTRFYIEQNSSQNLLPQKQAIEQSIEQLNASLKSLKAERDGVVKTHNQTLAAYNKRLEYINSEIYRLTNEKLFYPALETENARIIAALKSEMLVIQKEIANENSIYQNRKSNLDYSIKSTEESLGYTKQQDVDLNNEIATVSGTVSLKWISLWDFIDAYTPGALLGWVLAILAVLAYLWNRSYRQVTNEYF